MKRHLFAPESIPSFAVRRRGGWAWGCAAAAWACAWLPAGPLPAAPAADAPAGTSRESAPAVEGAPRAKDYRVDVADPDDALGAVTSRRFVALAMRVPRVVGAAIMGVSLIPLLWGWRILQAFMAAFCGVALGGIGFAFGTAAWGPAAGAAVGALAGIVGLFAGKFVSKLNRAFLGAGACGLLAAVPGALLGMPAAAWGLAVAGFALGLWLGWRYSQYVDAAQTTLLGAAVASAGAVVLVRDQAPSLLALAAGTVYIAACALGIVVQFRAVSDQRKWERRHDHLMKKG